MQVDRLDQRAVGRALVGNGVLDRQDVLRYTGAHTAGTMLEFRYPERILRRIVCTFIDERQTDGSSGPYAADIAATTLAHLVPEEIERVELLDFQGPGRPVMLQIFTRSFIMEMATRDLPLRSPIITPFGECF